MASKLTNSERSKRKKNYALYCVNIFGNGLKTIKDEFKRQVSTGLRQTVCVLDLEDLQAELNSLPHITKTKKHFKENSNTNLTHVMLNHIQAILTDYEKLPKQINEELKFDLYEYWLKQNGAIKNFKPDKTHNVKSGEETKNVKRKESAEMCTSTLTVKEHNRVGHSKPLSRRKYIKDEPILGKLYIIILGQMSKSCLTDLLRRDQPVEAIINFMPIESNYDIMLGNNKIRNFISSTLETINNSIFNLRQETLLKPVGLFTHRLPVISHCLATKNSREIFDQLTWSIYDIDILRRQYEEFYFKPFQVTDVEIPAGENITQLYHMYESLSAQGRFHNSSLSTTEADLASITGYLNSLLSICGVQEDVVAERSQTNLIFPNAFSTITKICKFDRLLVAANNNLLLSMLKHADLHDFNAIYLCCLDYNELGQFAISQHQMKANKRAGGHEPQLPQYVKYYVNKECSWQRITELKQEYDEYEIRELSDGHKLYIFRRNYYLLKECEKSVVIPTRLCFRDFTLFQMEEFLRDLKTPELNSITDTDKTAEDTEFEKNIFVRPNSLKAVMLQNELSEEVPNGQNESRSRRSAFLKNRSTNKENRGLPAGHHLLQGYNLNDTLQDLKFKTSLYNFHHGFVKLYEEKWCFQEMNKQLSLAIDNVTVFFSGVRNQRNRISNNVRLVTDNSISIRILNTDGECSRAIMNYPNGLGIYHHLDYCEQIWHSNRMPRDERTRILTNFGAIIVFFKSHDIKIMRYNGEVYRLYQHESGQEGDEDIKIKSSNLTEGNFQKDELRGRKLSMPTSKSRHSKKPSSEESIEISSSSKHPTDDLISYFTFELNFFNFICAVYGLTYLCFSITTSRGKVLDVTQQGEVSEKPQCSINEWFDYFANEAYCKRSDGVKMIWGQDSFKCFHEDGTVFKTTTEEDFAVADKDECESLITQSSSHKDFLEQTEAPYQQTALEIQSTDSDLTSAVSEEVCSPSDVEFAHFKCRNMFMQHPHYAEVVIRDLGSKSPKLEIFGINNIRIHTNKEECNANGSDIYEDLMENKSNVKLIINVSIHKNLKVKLDDGACEVYAMIPNEKKAESDSLSLSLKYTDNINDVFNCWVKEIVSLKRNNEPAVQELYFMEKINYDFSIRGFEFYSLLPTISPYKYQMSNNVIELKALDTINESCRENQEDLEKFPRFKKMQKEKFCQNPEKELPSSLSANVFIEIPQQLRNLTNITKFLEPFENVNFKSWRGKFKDALSYYLRPRLKLSLKILCSRINWKRRIWEHGRRVFNENQRRGLYIAMIKHETYPNYWKFTQAYGSDVRCIEFLDFVQNQCNCAGDQTRWVN